VRGLRGAARYAASSTGARASLKLVGANVVGLGGIYLYNLICIRWLGSARFGDVAAVTTLATILSVPFTGIQSALARDVARLESVGDLGGVRGLFAVVMRRGLFAQVVLIGALLAAAPVTVNVLHLASTGVAVAAVALVAVTVALPVLQGFLQGLGRFSSLAMQTLVLGLSKPLLAIPFILASATVGALIAGAVSAVLVAGLALFALRPMLAWPQARSPEHPLAGSAPVVIGLVAFSAMMNLDILVAKAVLPSHAAGTYAAASLVGKVTIYVPLAISIVLLPRAVALRERGEDAFRPVFLSVATVIGFGAVYSLILLAIPRSLVELTFGPTFGNARELLAPCALAMTLCGVVNIKLALSFAAREHGFVGLTLIGVALQVAMLAVFHSSPYEILAASAAGAALAIALHELRSPYALRRLAQAHFRGSE
jgi:O-antigen/teichoic acid export membrane protein